MERNALKPWLRGRRLVKVPPSPPGDFAALHQALCLFGVRLEGQALGVTGESATFSLNTGAFRRSPEVSPGWIEIGWVAQGPLGPVALVMQPSCPLKFRGEDAKHRARVNTQYMATTQGVLHQLGAARIPVLVKEVRVASPRHLTSEGPRGLQMALDALGDPAIAPNSAGTPRWPAGSGVGRGGRSMTENCAGRWPASRWRA